MVHRKALRILWFEFAFNLCLYYLGNRVKDWRRIRMDSSTMNKNSWSTVSHEEVKKYSTVLIKLGDLKLFMLIFHCAIEV